MERPYEKLEKYGPKYLSDAELIAIILRSGIKNRSSVEIARELLFKSKGKIRDVFILKQSEYMKIKGLGRVRSMQLLAVGELIKRVERPIDNAEIIISSSADLAKYLMPEMRYLKKEELRVLFLDAKNAIKHEKIYTSDNMLSVEVEPIAIIKEAIMVEMPNIILAHNHPSGRVKPSNSDIKYTKKLKELCKTFKIDLLDHIIIGDGKYISIMDC